MIANRRIIAASGFLLLFAASCSRAPEIESNRTAAAGVVIFDGKPLPGGTIALISADDPNYRVSALIGTDGSFAVADAPLGKVQVTIETESFKIGYPAGYVAIPDKYAKLQTTPLTAEITRESKQPLSIELESG